MFNPKDRSNIKISPDEAKSISLSNLLEIALDYEESENLQNENLIPLCNKRKKQKIQMLVGEIGVTRFLRLYEKSKAYITKEGKEIFRDFVLKEESICPKFRKRVFK